MLLWGVPIIPTTHNSDDSTIPSLERLYYLSYYFQLYSVVLFSFDAAISAYLLVGHIGKKPCVASFCLCFLFYFYSLITFLTMMFLLVVTFLTIPPPPHLLPPALHLSFTMEEEDPKLQKLSL